MLDIILMKLLTLGLLFYIWVISYSFVLAADLDPSALPQDDVAMSQDDVSISRDYVGLTFSAPGPNCFSSALKISGVTSSFRAMDVKEFETIRDQYCVPVSQPRSGDIGVFETPGFGATHAYVYISEELGIQKPGVDYAGKTPIAVQALSSISYTFLASPECRRYSRDISECSNKHYYLRCESFQSELNKENAILEERVRLVESRIEALLREDNWTSVSKKEVQNLKILIADLGQFKSSVAGTKKWRTFVDARQISLEKQLTFLEIKAQSLP